MGALSRLKKAHQMLLPLLQQERKRVNFVKNWHKVDVLSLHMQFMNMLVTIMLIVVGIALFHSLPASLMKQIQKEECT